MIETTIFMDSLIENPVAFKEWAVICEMLGSGRQTLILRRGGISEGRAGFSFEGHDSFFLYPTLFHEAQDSVTETLPEPQFACNPIAPGPDGEVEVTLAARVIYPVELQDLKVVQSLQPFHVWTPQVIRDRFEWKKKNRINLAIVRIFRLATPWRFPNSPDFGGCTSWITLPKPPENLQLIPVLTNAQFQQQVSAITKVLADDAQSGDLGR